MTRWLHLLIAVARSMQVTANGQMPAGELKAVPALASAGHSLPAAAGPLQRWVTCTSAAAFRTSAHRIAQRPRTDSLGTDLARNKPRPLGATSTIRSVALWLLLSCRPLQHAASAPAAPEPPSGPPPLIGCSQCRKPMHLDCFVAHYGVVPARRDYTYCPAHVYVPKPKPPGGERKLAAASTHGGGHKRDRGEREGGERKKKRRAERPPSPGA